MIDNTGYILYGFEIDENTFIDQLEEKCESSIDLLKSQEGEDFESVDDFLEKYCWNENEDVHFIDDPMCGETAYFGVILYHCDLDESEEAFEIPTNINEYLEKINDFANKHKVLYNALSSNATNSKPSLLFAVVKS